MFAPLAPILASNTDESVETQALAARVEALAAVLGTVAQLAGITPERGAESLSQRADLYGLLAALPADTTQILARDLETVGVVLQAGLLALDKARGEGRFSRAAARLLHEEAQDQYRKALVDMRSLTQG